VTASPPRVGEVGLPTSPLLDRIRASVIGDDAIVEGPYGPRRVTYADYTASGRALTFLEDFVRAEVLPRYANTHTESSGTGLQTTRLREDSRKIIRAAVGGDEDTLVIFTGSETASRQPEPGVAPADSPEAHPTSGHERPADVRLRRLRRPADRRRVRRHPPHHLLSGAGPGGLPGPADRDAAPPGARPGPTVHRRGRAGSARRSGRRCAPSRSRSRSRRLFGCG